MNTEAYNNASKKISDEAIRFRDQLIIMSGGVLTIFVSIHGGEGTSNFIKFGFVSIGFSLIFGVLAIVLKLFSSLLPLYFHSQESISEDKKEIHRMRELIGKLKTILSKKEVHFEEHPKIEDLLSEMQYSHMHKVLLEEEKRSDDLIVICEEIELFYKKNNNSGDFFLKRYMSSGSSVSVFIFCSILQTVLFITGVILIIFSIF